ncbi:rCG63162 [Rattus norvegicus]|uniref:RCG63162 n=1 Tax=Rattus norvegicus TaxID=10116 RepID=A6KE79_RAT|nr:rCG63162 [Rattus norvegicus]
MSLSSTCLQSKFQDSQGYTGAPCLKKMKTKKLPRTQTLPRASSTLDLL